VEYEIQATDEFSAWFEEDLNLAEQKSVTRVVKMLKNSGPALPFPYKFRNQRIEVLSYA
jgi:hypothetical protein